MYLRKEEIKLVHLEITSKCNLLCPQCARTSRGRLNPELPIADLQWGPSLDEMFSESFSRQLDGVYFCGNFGDPAAASTLPVFVENLLSRGVSHIAVYSNGSLKSPEWWYELGESLKGRGRLIFQSMGCPTPITFTVSTHRGLASKPT